MFLGKKSKNSRFPRIAEKKESRVAKDRSGCGHDACIILKRNLSLSTFAMKKTHSILCVTTPDLQGQEIVEHFPAIAAIDSTGEDVQESWAKVLESLAEQAQKLGANAVVAVRADFEIAFRTNRSQIVVVCATGTPVRTERR